MNHDMKLIQSWLTANKSTLNIKKTKFILTDYLKYINDFTIRLMLEKVSEHKNLDESLTWRPHINDVTKKIS